MSLPVRQAAHRISVPAASFPSSSSPSKSRLFRINQKALPPIFFASREGSLVGTCKYFTLISRRLTNQILDNVNKGPSWLAAPYPPGLLHARHEKLRLINHVKIDTFRTGLETEKDHLKKEQEMKNLAMKRLPVLEKDNNQNDRIPTLIIASKKRVHKLAVVRFEVLRKLWRAFDQVIQELEGSPNQLPRDSASLFILAATKEAHDASLEQVRREVFNILTRLATRRAHSSKNDGKQKQGKAFFKQKKYQR